MKLLIVDCCIREEKSATRKLYESYLKSLNRTNWEIEKIYLMHENILPLTNNDIKLRDKLLQSSNTEHEIFKYAKQFAAADEIIIAAPYWDLSFPSLLRVYFERISVVGITFDYEGTKSIGCCKAGKIIYFSTCGGFINGEHLGVEYVKQLAKVFGINNVEKYIVEGLDIDTTKREKISGYFQSFDLKSQSEKLFYSV